MESYTDAELDKKIHNFLERKAEIFPELRPEQVRSPRTPMTDTGDRLNELLVRYLSFVQLRPQH